MFLIPNSGWFAPRQSNDGSLLEIAYVSIYMINCPRHETIHFIVNCIILHMIQIGCDAILDGSHAPTGQMLYEGILRILFLQQTCCLSLAYSCHCDWAASVDFAHPNAPCCHLPCSAFDPAPVTQRGRMRLS